MGAGGPVEDSVTKLFYDRGWSGINIEPGPKFVKLEASRPRDVNLRIAVSSDETQREFRVSKSHPGLSTFYPTESRERLPGGFSFESELVQRRTLQHILDEHGRGCQVDFLKIDVEGAEADVLRSLDLIATRPTVLLVEAVTPRALERVLAETRASLERERSRLVALREVYAVRRWLRHRVIGSIRRRLTLRSDETGLHEPEVRPLPEEISKP